MTNSNYTYPNTIQNQMIPENIYGLQGKDCRMQGNCIPNTFNQMETDSALHEMATYNDNAQRAAILENPQNEQASLMQATQAQALGGSTSGEPVQFNGNLQQLPGVNQIENYDLGNEMIQTPANTLPQGATLHDSVKINLGIPLTQSQMPVTPESLQFHNGFLRSQIGRRVTVDFLMGSGTTVQKSGYLLGVAQDYILINELDTNDITTCDFYNIKFMRFYY